jgi:glycogen operon protein
MLSEAGVKDITWVTPSGNEATDDDWNNPVALSLGYVLSGAAGEFFTTGGQRDIDASFLVMLNAYYEDIDFHIPSLAAPMSWEPLVDTSQPTGRVATGKLYEPGEFYRLKAHSFVRFINRAPRQELSSREAAVTSVVPADRAEPGEDDATPS